MKTKAAHSNLFLAGLRDGLPIGLGYFAVSFAVGIMAAKAGLTVFQGFLMSLLTNASAGEYAGLQVILEDAGYLAMIGATLVASARYFLMSFALSQHLRPELPVRHRLLIAFDLTDEIFGATIARPGYAEPKYIYALFILPLIGWSSGTALGIAIGSVLPASVVTALSVSLYGMFLAIIIPPARKNKAVAIAVVSAFALSFAASRLPYVSGLSSSLRTIALTVVITTVIALVFPVKDDPYVGETGGAKSVSEETEAGA